MTRKTKYNKKRVKSHPLLLEINKMRFFGWRFATVINPRVHLICQFNIGSHCVRFEYRIVRFTGVEIVGACGLFGEMVMGDCLGDLVDRLQVAESVVDCLFYLEGFGCGGQGWLVCPWA